MKSRPRVALVHDHLVQDGGAEQVLRVLMKMYPEAPVYTAFFDPERMGSDFAGRVVRTSYLQRIPLARRFYKWTLPQLDGAFRRFDLRGYELVISSASAWAKSVRAAPATMHVCYCHTPTRYLWSDRERYRRELGYPRPLKAAIKWLTPSLQRKDLRAAAGVDDFVANSAYVAKRIERYYGRYARVIYPPVDISKFAPATSREDYYLLAGRLEPHKRNDVAIEAANELGESLVLMGSGTDRQRLERLAGPTVRFTGRVSDAERRDLLARARALIVPQVEDFGIVAVEAMASGTPVLAYREGGAAEIVTERTGEFFDDQTPDAIANAIRRFDPGRYHRAGLLERADGFGVPRFERQLRGYLDAAYERFQSRLGINR